MALESYHGRNTELIVTAIWSVRAPTKSEREPTLGRESWISFVHPIKQIRTLPAGRVADSVMMAKGLS